jgi:hypothetical protein
MGCRSGSIIIPGEEKSSSILQGENREIEKGGGNACPPSALPV